MKIVVYDLFFNGKYIETINSFNELLKYKYGNWSKYYTYITRVKKYPGTC